VPVRIRPAVPLLPALRHPHRRHHRRVFRGGHPRRFRRTAQEHRGGHRRRPNPPHPRRVPPTAGVRDRRHQAPGVSQLLPHRVGFHPPGPRAGHRRRTGPRFGGRQPGRLFAPHHGPGPAAVRPAVRTLPQPRAHLAPRHRHRFLRPASRGGHPLRHREVRQGLRLPDRHLRHHEGPGGGPRRGTRVGHVLHRRGPHRQTHPHGAEHHPGAGAPGGAAPAGGHRRDGRAESRGAAAHRHLPPPRGAEPAQLHPRRRRGHRPAAAGGHHPHRHPRRGRSPDPVQHEGHREARLPEDGLPGAHHPHGDPGHPADDPDQPRARPRHRPHPARRCAHLPDLLRGPHRRHLPV